MQHFVLIRNEHFFPTNIFSLLLLVRIDSDESPDHYQLMNKFYRYLQSGRSNYANSWTYSSVEFQIDLETRYIRYRSSSQGEFDHIHRHCCSSITDFLATWPCWLPSIREANRRTSSTNTSVRFLFLFKTISIRFCFNFRRRHYLAISAPAIPPAPEAPLPGPGAYELRDFKDAEKKYMSTAAFVSNTSRWTIDTTVAAHQPGPASYAPYPMPPKQSFNFNFGRKWIW